MTSAFKKAVIAIAALFMCGCSMADESITSAGLAEGAPVTVTEASERSDTKKLECLHYYEKDFDIYTSMIESYPAEGEIVCGTVPHHLTAGRMTAAFMQAAAESREKTDAVVIIGTMHEYRDNAVVSSYLDWNAPFGTVKNDSEITDILISETDAYTDDQLMEYDHAVSSVIPFVSNYFPDVPVSCLLVSAKAPKDTPERLCEALEKVSAEKDCLFVFSIDFSHYLSPNETEQRDAQTLEAVMNADLDMIARMTDSNVDSAYLLGTFVRFTGNMNCKTLCLDNSNALKITGLPYNRTTFPEGLTSYFIFAGEK